MFYDLEQVIFKAFSSNEKITDYVSKTKEGYPNIGCNRVPIGTFPLIEFHKIHGSSKLFANDEEVLRQYNYQVGLYTEHNDYSLIENEINKEMENIGFHCYNDYTYAVDDTKVIHRIFSYSITISESMYFQIMQKYKIEIGD